MLSDSLIFWKQIFTCRFLLDGFQNSNYHRGWETFLCFVFLVYKQSLLIHEYWTKTEVHRGMISFLDKYIIIQFGENTSLMITIIVFLLFMHSLLTYILQLCCCKSLLFSNNKLICSFVYFFVQISTSVKLDIQKGYLTSSPKYSEQQWIEKKNYCRVSLYG